MECEVLLFGVAREIVGSSKTMVKLESDGNVDDLMTSLKRSYPDFERLTSFVIAINNEYADSERKINDGDEVAVIPPVSGG
jgi:molybdopterin synthase sulfur carrier subunit